MRSSPGRGLLLLVLICSGQVTAGARALAGQEAAAHGSRTLSGRAIDALTQVPLAGTRIELAGTGRSAETGADGSFAFVDVTGEVVRLRAARLGYATLDTTLVLAGGPAHVILHLRALPFDLAPLTTRAERLSGGAERERAMFDREVTPGLVGISGQELQDLPAVGEPDVLRSLQVLPGVVFLNDLSARLHVRGGAPDQNLFLLDGARVFAPYHMFGMVGAFNTDAVARVEMYRGALPARYGGALSSVIDLRHEDGASAGRQYDGGISVLGARVMVRDLLPAARGSWMLAARRTHLDLIAGDLLGKDFPYGFYDVNARVTLRPQGDHRVRASFFSSSDGFRLFLDDDDSRLASSWRNVAGSLRWERGGQDAWQLAGEAWGSHYDARLRVGVGTESPVTSNAVDMGGLRLEVARRGGSFGFRAGSDIQGGRVALLGGDRPGGYVDGDTRAGFVESSAYLEAEAWLGPARVAPGLRATLLPGGQPVLSPRLAGRLHLSEDIVLTVGASRAYQSLSTVRDDRFPLPGPPFWFLHPASSAASRADGVSAGLEGWLSRSWSFGVGTYVREFTHIPRWRPVGARDLSQVAFDPGRAEGIELLLRRHTRPVTGWIGYGLGRVSATESETGLPYAPTWDRRHSVDVALMGHVRHHLDLSARLSYGSGVPFWPTVGENDGLRFDSRQGKVQLGDSYPVWAAEQMRFPAHARLDLGLRYRRRWGSVEVEPHLDFMNVLGRPNVLYYDLGVPGPTPGPGGAAEAPARLTPVAMPAFTVPSLGLSVRF
jgi:hypothetical protein